MKKFYYTLGYLSGFGAGYLCCRYSKEISAAINGFITSAYQSARPLLDKIVSDCDCYDDCCCFQNNQQEAVSELTEADYETPVTEEASETTKKDSNETTDADDSSEIPSDEVIIGNKNTKVFHRQSCVFCPKQGAKHVVTFDSIQNAEESGYKACNNCMK